MSGFEAKVWKCVFLVFLLTSASAQNSPNISFTLQTVAQLAKYFYSDCVLLVTHSLAEDVTVVHSTKYLSSQGFGVLTLGVSALVEWNRRLQRICNRPINVLPWLSRDLALQLKQLSLESLLSSSTWLLMLNSTESPQGALRDVHVPFDCEFLVGRASIIGVRLSEVHRVAAGLPLQEAEFGLWRPKTQLSTPNVGFYTRRNSLRGLVMKTTDEHDPPISVLNNKTKQVLLEGFSGMVWKVFERRMVFTTSHSGLYEGVGSQTSNGSWDGMIGAVLRSEVNMTSSIITMTPDTSQVVDFMFPLYTIYSRIFIRLPDSHEVYWDNFLAPFSSMLWIAFLVLTLVTAALLSVLYHVARRFDDKEERYSLYDAVFLVFGAIFCQQGHERTPRSPACRIVHILMYVTAVIAINSYSGSIISNLTVFKQQMPFNNLHELHDEGSYSLGILKGSFVYTMFKNGSQQFVRELYERHIASDAHAPIDNLAGFSRTCDSKFAFVSTDEAESVVRDDIGCRVVHLPEHFVKFSASLAFPKRSPYRGLFNHNLLKLINSGVISNLYKSAVKQRLSTTVVELESIDLDAVAPILSIMAGGVVLGLILLASEHVVIFLASRGGAGVVRVTPSMSVARIARLRMLQMRVKQRLA